MSFLIFLICVSILTIMVWKFFYNEDVTISEETFFKELQVHEKTSKNLRMIELCKVDRLRLEQRSSKICWVWTCFDGRWEILSLNFISELIFQFCIERNILFSKIVSASEMFELLDLRAYIMSLIFNSFHFITPNRLTNTPVI